MPIIHKLELVNLSTIPTANRSRKIREEKYNRNPMSGLEDNIFNCICFHPEHNHFAGKCAYFGEWCDCEKFVPLQLKIIAVINEADLFEFENEEHSERDSLSWWNEFESWRRLRC